MWSFRLDLRFTLWWRSDCIRGFTIGVNDWSYNYYYDKPTILKPE